MCRSPGIIVTQPFLSFGVHNEFQNPVKNPQSILNIGSIRLPLCGIKLGHPTGQVMAITMLVSATPWFTYSPHGLFVLVAIHGRRR